MTELAVRQRLAWRVATVAAVRDETAAARTLVLDVPDWPGHLAGQHVDVRLTAEDGYSAQRSYSLASTTVELTVQSVVDGEVSPYLVGVAGPGDQFELRGPVGGHFTWSVHDGGPLLMVAGGSGLVPLMSMLRHRAAQGSHVATTMLVSARGVDDILYRDELMDLRGAGDGLDLRETLTRGAPDGWAGFARRVDREMLAEIGPDPSARPRVFICGPTAFVENAADLLVALGHEPAAIHAERFGPTGA